MSEAKAPDKQKLASFKALSTFLRAFGTTRRLAILASISQEERTVSEIAEETHLQTQIVSQNLSLMLDKGAVHLRRSGRNAYYRCSNAKFCDGLTLMRAGLEEVHSARGMDSQES